MQRVMGKEASSWQALVECVPNFSEGRRAEVIEAIVNAAKGVSGVRLLHYAANSDHNRLVVTLVGEPEAVKKAVYAAAQVAVSLIDMEKHQGAHPRIGAVDVVPFVPVRGTSLADCVRLAQEFGAEIATGLGVPVYLYGEAARRPERRELGALRRGGYEALKVEMGRPEREPDFGPARLHPRAGATIVGARQPLVAFNVNLGTSDLNVARAVSRAVRAGSGGLVGVRAIAVELKERRATQVSMNLTDVDSTPVYRVYELVKAEAARFGVPVVGTEIVGVVPVRALLDAAAYYLRLERFAESQVLELRLAEEEGDHAGPEG